MNTLTDLSQQNISGNPMKSKTFIKLTDKGIYCIPGKFYIDPWKPVDLAVISHGHGDHARWGMKKYLCHHFTKPILQPAKPQAWLYLSPSQMVEQCEFYDIDIEQGCQISLSLYNDKNEIQWLYDEGFGVVKK